jgi:hypothetical protein
MKSMSLVALVVLISTPLWAADKSNSASQPSDENNLTAELYTRGEPMAGSEAQFINPQKLAGAKIQYQFKRDPQTSFGDERACYTMHSIKVARPNKNSDETTKAGEQTCTAASKFTMKSAAPEGR